MGKNIIFMQGNINFSIPSGFICGLIGENGAGKTTFFRMLLGRERGVFGEITILGKGMPSERV